MDTSPQTVETGSLDPRYGYAKLSGRPIMRIIALDPGVTTGYATGIVDAGKMYVVSGQARWGHLELWEFLTGQSPDVVITETFEFRNQSRIGLELYSREMIGVTKLYIQLINSRNVLIRTEEIKLVEQTPGVVSTKSYFNDNRLKEDKLYKPANPHANDAMRHLLQWFQFGPGYKYNTDGYEGAA